jgi:hypothetical protein
VSAVPAELRRRWRRARLRMLAQALAWWLPLLGAVAVLAMCFATRPVALAWTVGTGVLAVAWLGWRWRVCDAAWCARQLDAAHPALEDSAGLLFADPATLSPLQSLQRERLRSRLPALPRATLGPRWPWARIVAAGLLAVAAGGLAWRGPTPTPAPPTDARAPAVAAVTRVEGFELAITPPPATGLPARRQTTWSARVPAGAQLRWRLRLSPAPRAAWLLFHDGTRLALQRGPEATWQAEQRLLQGRLYRLVLDPAAPPLAGTTSGRLDAIADQAPHVRVLAPTANPVQYHGEGALAVRFLAEDDYALAANATLQLVRAAGSGENVTFSRRQRMLTGHGTPRALTFAFALDPHALGMQPGDELVAKLEVRDRGGQSASSPSVILRWPLPEVASGAGVDGLARATLPAYFRSQRQIIIDAEALLRDRARISADTFTRRANALGDDQRALRLRYGQFLGMEADGAPQLPVADDDHAGHDDHPQDNDLPLAEATPTPAPASPPAATAPDDHDHAGAPAGAAPPRFGDAAGVTAEFGHVHDLPEAATLLDPGTKTLLRGALDAMWDSELHLRQADPRAALPFAYRALRLIKQVQQADRIYLARIGNELPPYDAARRMQGKREDIAPRPLTWTPLPDDDRIPAQAWQALSAPGVAVDLAPLQAWLVAHPARSPDPLTLAAAIEALEREPRCVRCREALAAALWPVLSTPLAVPARHAQPDDEGRRYLDALQRLREEGQR